MPPPTSTTKRRTTNLKTKNNQNWQKIEPYGSPTTKELKKKHSSRPVGGEETASGAERTRVKVVAGGPGWVRQWLADQARQWLTDWAVSHSCAGKPGGTTREWDRLCNPGFQFGEIKPQNLWLKKTCGGWGSRRNSKSHRRVYWRDPHDPRMYTYPPTQELAPEEPNLLVGSWRSDWKPTQSWASSIVPSHTPPQHTAPEVAKWVAPP